MLFDFNVKDFADKDTKTFCYTITNYGIILEKNLVVSNKRFIFAL
jgi:hypothetical protein